MWSFTAKQSLLGIFSALSIAAARPHSKTPLPLTTKEIFQFSESIWIENFAVRRNGALLLTTITPNASVYEVADPTSPSPSVSLVYTLPGASSLFGITETAPDVFVVAGANYTGGTGFEVNSTSIFSLDFNHKKGPVAKTIAALPQLHGPNGVTTLSAKPPVVLIADSVNGEVWELNTKTGHHSVAVKAPEMDPVIGNPWAYIGINGIRISDGWLYFTNFDTVNLFRTKLRPRGYGNAKNPVETVLVAPKEIAAGFDDFTIGPDSTLYLTTNVNSSVIAVKPDGKGGFLRGVVIAQNDDLLAGDTAAAFGRTKKDQHLLYVVTSSSKVVAVDTRKH